jgi:urease accessory protein
MIEFCHKTTNPPPSTLGVTLTWEERQRSRLRVRLDDGQEAGIRLPRGTRVCGGDWLLADDGQAVLVRAAAECLSRIECQDALTLARVCYHLGNRHVAVQIEAGQICYRHDHVLDDLVRGLGLEVQVLEAPFEPEAGAYGGHAHGEGSGHGSQP